MTMEDPPQPESAPEAELGGGSKGEDETSPTEREDQTLTCVQCGSQFVFSADEQAFFTSKDLHAPPKRCKACRQERRKARRRGGRMKDYRGPAFQEKRKLDKIYRSPAFQKKQDIEGIYRSPAFAGQSDGEEEIYRSPAFQDQVDNSEIYRAPAFQRPVFEDDEPEEGEALANSEPEPEGEHDLELGPPPGWREPSSTEEIYRSPAFSNTDPANYAPSYRQREMHAIICADCGKKSKIPFKPQKNRSVYCRDCFQKRK